MEKIQKQVILLLLLWCSAALAELSTEEKHEIKKRIERSSLDICSSPSGLIDLSSLAHSGYTPWNIAEKRTNETHYYDFSPCTKLKSNSYPEYNIPETCKEHNLCYRVIDNGGKLISAEGYSLKHLSSQLNMVLATYVGPPCSSQPVNSTIEIRFSCGVHLSHPKLPPFRNLLDQCKKFLEWETLVACKNKSTAKISLDTATRCYVLDGNGSPRDLTPLIKPNGSYRVWSLNSDPELYINVCGEVKNCSLPGSSACLNTGLKTMETVGLHAWANLHFHQASEELKHDYIELTYRLNTPQNVSVTRIRFLCPSDFGISANTRRDPILVSSLDNEYQIDWITDYACAKETITSDASYCEFEGLDFNNLKQKDFEFNVKGQKLGHNSTKIVLNLCESSKSCGSMTQACLFENNSPISLGSRLDSSFGKFDGRVFLMLASKKATCTDGSNLRYERTTVEFECDESMQDEGVPQFSFYDLCEYKFKWRTPFVCPLLKPKLPCSFNDNGLAIDLSPLIKNLTSYTVENSRHKIVFNVCDRLNRQVYDCPYGSAACLVDSFHNRSMSLGFFTSPPTYDYIFNSVKLVYTNGYDSILKKKLQTHINFYCSSEDHEPELVEVDEIKGQYMIDWKTRSACSYKSLTGTNCIVVDYLNGRLYDLNKLRSSSFYTVKTEQYEFEVNICGPIVGGSCEENSSICQKELHGGRRKFNLGQANSNFLYWDSTINMTFTNGTPYNDNLKTPRKSHIEFICDYTVGEGYPVFNGEKDKAYFFRWYTSLVCPEPPPKVTHCVYENATHFIDLTPLSLLYGNHFSINQHAMFFINFCRPVNQPSFTNCSSNTGVCMVYPREQSISLGQPSSHPFRGFDDDSINLIFDNGDRCPGDHSKFLTSRFRFECDNSIESEVDITLIKPNQLININNVKDCHYEFLVRSPIACAKKFDEYSLDKCLYVDPVTNLSADLSLLRSPSIDHSVRIKDGSSSFFLNVCQPTKSVAKNCSGAAICLHRADNTLINYGKADVAKVYMHGSNLHLRYTGGAQCDSSIDNRGRSTDIKLICDRKEVTSAPTLLHYDYCFAQFEWRTQAVCNLVVPSCSIYDSNGKFYSLRQLSSLAHTWNVSANSKEEYIINVCKPLPINSCGTSAGACRIERMANGSVKQHIIGRVSDHEITINETTGNLYLTYEDGEHTPGCNAEPIRTQIMFHCDPNNYGLSGPNFLSLNHCTYHFVWNTQFACPHESTEYLNITMNEKFRVVDKITGTHWDLASIFNSSFVVLDTKRSEENYTYVFDFKRSNSNYQCAHSAICQTKGTSFYRDIGTQGHWQIALIADELSLVIDSNTGPNQMCGRNSKRHVASQIFFKCAHGIGLGHPEFLYESDDCDYFFLWESVVACPIEPDMTDDSFSPHESTASNSSSSSTGTILLVLFLLCVIAFIGWIVFSKSTKRDEISQYLRRMVRGKPVGSDIPFRYQQEKFSNGRI